MNFVSSQLAIQYRALPEGDDDMDSAVPDDKLKSIDSFICVNKLCQYIGTVYTIPSTSSISTLLTALAI